MSSTGGKKARLSRALDSHIRNIEETFQILVKSVAEKVEWSQVIKLGDEVSKQATIAGMLWSGEEPEIKQVEENMEAYFNVLHGFVLLCHNSAAGAGPTLHASICSSARRVIDSSLALLKESVSIESHKFSNKSSIPRLSGSVWEACANLKKTPTSNCAAIGRAIARVAVSVKDILREMNELKPAAPNTSNDALREEDDSDDEEFGADLSPEEMLIVQLTIKAVSDVLVILKEAIRFVSGLHDENVEQVNGLETLLRCCQDIGNEANELGASVYPPQEISMLKSTSEKIYIVIDEMKKVVEMVGGSDQSFLGYFERLEDSLKKMESGLCGNLINEIERLAL